MTKKLLAPLALGTALALAFAGHALADSQYGYTTGTGTITAQANIKLSVAVPKLILLRVGSSNTTIDTVSWTAGFSIPAVPTAPVAGNNTGVDWNGAAPASTLNTPAGVTVYAWTNASTGTLTCAAPTWVPATGGPANTDFTVTVTGTLPHPGTNLACGAASATIPSNTVATGTWTYSLASAAAATWKAGTYAAQVTYTATGV